jgi:hypothetical protein
MNNKRKMKKKKKRVEAREAAKMLQCSGKSLS